MERRLPSTRVARCQCVFLTFVVLFPVCLYVGVVIHNVLRLSNDVYGGKCPAGYLPCDVTSDHVTCVSSDDWCNERVDCPNGEDEDKIDCYDKMGYYWVYENTCQDRSENISPKTVKLKGCLVVRYPTNCSCRNLNVYCSNKGYGVVPSRQLSDNISGLSLAYNEITQISYNDFNQFEDLTFLNLEHNLLEEIVPRTFSSLSKLRDLFLSANKLTTIHPGTFIGLSKLVYLYLDHNNIRVISEGSFLGLDNICLLSLRSNQLTLGFSDNFFALPSLALLELQKNRIENVTATVFSNLYSLQALHLSDNLISSVDDQAFDHSQLIDLDLSGNQLCQLPTLFGTRKLAQLRFLSLADNPIVQLSETEFEGIGNLKALNLSGVKLESLHRDAFKPLTRLSVISLNSFETCRYAPMVRICYPRGDGISTVANLLESSFLRVSIWLVAITTCAGNAFVIVCRMLFREEKNVHSLFIKNLAAADFMMGVYLLLVATHDSLYRDQYNRHALTWMDSWTCQATGLLAVLSSQVSVFVLVTMSIDCCLTIALPYRPPPTTTLRRALPVLAAIWAVGATLAGVPAAVSRLFYGSNGVCLPLHVHDPFLPGWQFSAALFVGVNGVAVLTVAVCYATMCVSVQRIGRAAHDGRGGKTTVVGGAAAAAAVGAVAGGSGRGGAPPAGTRRRFAMERFSTGNSNRRVAQRLFIIVLTNVLCWIPVIVVKLIAFTDIRISDDLYAWLTVFVLPINSALNPLIYTITTPSFRRKLSEHWPIAVRLNDEAAAAAAGVGGGGGGGVDSGAAVLCWHQRLGFRCTSCASCLLRIATRRRSSLVSSLLSNLSSKRGALTAPTGTGNERRAAVDGPHRIGGGGCGDVIVERPLATDATASRNLPQELENILEPEVELEAECVGCVCGGSGDREECEEHQLVLLIDS